MQDHFPVIGGPTPWHLWGSSQVVNAIDGRAQSVQLVRINYSRPDSFRFMYSVAVPAGTPPLSVIIVTFQFVAGIGRDAIQLPDNLAAVFFAQEVIPAGIAPNVAVVRTRALPNDWAGLADTNHAIEVIPAQDLQVWALITANTAAVGTPVKVSAQVAPNVHVRPDWYARKFEGGELGGT
jgi:hypothetical protein